LAASLNAPSLRGVMHHPRARPMVENLRDKSSKESPGRSRGFELSLTKEKPEGPEPLDAPILSQSTHQARIA